MPPCGRPAGVHPTTAPCPRQPCTRSSEVERPHYKWDDDGSIPSACTMAEKETERCCRGQGDHEEWCHLYLTGAPQPHHSRRPRQPSKLAKRMKRARSIANQRERQLLAARTRVLPEASLRVTIEPSRMNSAFVGLEGAYNEAVSASLQTEEAWWRLWEE